MPSYQKNLYEKVCLIKKYPGKAYELKEGWHFMNPDGTGIKVSDVINYPHNFIQADSVDELVKLENEYEFNRKYPVVVEGEEDVKCPKCARGFCLDYYTYEGVNENHQTVIKCICGCRFLAAVDEVVIKCSAKVI